jgi:hypothetical protein
LFAYFAYFAVKNLFHEGRLLQTEEYFAVPDSLNKASAANMATLQPVLSPMLWTSIATGKRPYKHGIHGLSEPDPPSGGIRPVTNLSRKTKAIYPTGNVSRQDQLHHWR